LGNLFYEKLPGMHRCPSSQLAQRAYTIAMGTVPKISVEGMSRVIPMIVFGWLSDLGITDMIDIKQHISTICPGPNCLKNMLVLSRHSIYMKLAHDISSNKCPVAVLTDKGRRGGLDRLAIQAAIFDEKSDRVKLRTISADASHGTDNDVAEMVNYVFDWVDNFCNEDDNKVKLLGWISDHGGGGIGENLMKEVKNGCPTRVDLNKVYVLYCSMHALNRSFQVAVVEGLGPGGLENNTLVQFLHTVYSVQDALGEEFKNAWMKFVSGPDGLVTKKLCKPLLTRWGYVLQCATDVADDWDGWVKLLDKGLYKNTLTKEEEMAKKCLSTMKDPKLKVELEFLVAFSKIFFNKHFV
jgi:hypothetical protein